MLKGNTASAIAKLCPVENPQRREVIVENPQRREVIHLPKDMMTGMATTSPVELQLIQKRRMARRRKSSKREGREGERQT